MPHCPGLDEDICASKATFEEVSAHDSQENK